MPLCIKFFVSKRELQLTSSLIWNSYLQSLKKRKRGILIPARTGFLWESPYRRIRLPSSLLAALTLTCHSCHWFIAACTRQIFSWTHAWLRARAASQAPLLHSPRRRDWATGGVPPAAVVAGGRVLPWLALLSACPLLLLRW